MNKCIFFFSTLFVLSPLVLAQDIGSSNRSESTDPEFQHYQSLAAQCDTGEITHDMICKEARIYIKYYDKTGLRNSGAKVASARQKLTPTKIQQAQAADAYEIKTGASYIHWLHETLRGIQTSTNDQSIENTESALRYLTEIYFGASRKLLMFQFAEQEQAHWRASKNQIKAILQTILERSHAFSSQQGYTYQFTLYTDCLAQLEKQRSLPRKKRFGKASTLSINQKIDDYNSLLVELEGRGPKDIDEGRIDFFIIDFSRNIDRIITDTFGYIAFMKQRRVTNIEELRYHLESILDIPEIQLTQNTEIDKRELVAPPRHQRSTNTCVTESIHSVWYPDNTKGDIERAHARYITMQQQIYKPETMQTNQDDVDLRAGLWVPDVFYQAFSNSDNPTPKAGEVLYLTKKFAFSTPPAFGGKTVIEVLLDQEGVLVLPHLDTDVSIANQPAPNRARLDEGSMGHLVTVTGYQKNLKQTDLWIRNTRPPAYPGGELSQIHYLYDLQDIASHAYGVVVIRQ